MVSVTEELLLGGFYTVGTLFRLFQTNGAERQRSPGRGFS